MALRYRMQGYDPTSEELVYWWSDTSPDYAANQFSPSSGQGPGSELERVVVVMQTGSQSAESEVPVLHDWAYHADYGYGASPFDLATMPDMSTLDNGVALFDCTTAAGGQILRITPPKNSDLFTGRVVAVVDDTDGLLAAARFCFRYTGSASAGSTGASHTAGLSAHLGEVDLSGVWAGGFIERHTSANMANIAVRMYRETGRGNTPQLAVTGNSAAPGAPVFDIALVRSGSSVIAFWGNAGSWNKIGSYVVGLPGTDRFAICASARCNWETLDGSFSADLVALTLPSTFAGLPIIP